MKKIKIIFGLFLMIFLVGFVSAVCCERTIGEGGTGGGVCLDVGDRQYCDPDYRIDDTTACESTQYCSTGTCVNNAEGTCAISSSSACDPNLGGFWYAESADNIAECKYGCCFIGEGTSFIHRTTCNKRSADAKISPDFRDSITTWEECMLNAGPTAEGACVFETEEGRECTIETREKCLELGRDPHAGLLCSAPELGTICTMTERTRCVDGRHEVYFEDNCDNAANVYDASKVDNIDYWTYMKDFASSELCGYGLSNTNSKVCGNCNYLAGSTCGSARGTGVNPESGDNICINLNCTYKGETRAHDTAWCSQPISYFENAKPGDLSYRLYCFQGEVQWELKDNRRNKLCKEDVPGEANYVSNRWQDCVFQNSSKDCLNTEQRDCKVLEGVSRKNDSGGDILLLNYIYTYDYAGEVTSESIDSIKATCVARYPPGFDFWNPDAAIYGNSPEFTPAYVCIAGSVSSAVGYHKRLASDWKAKDYRCVGECIEKCSDWVIGKPECQETCFWDCPASESFLDMEGSGQLGVGEVDLNLDWTENREELCVSLGDCGVKANYVGGDSYYSWKELFIGDNITKTNIFEADEYQ